MSPADLAQLRVAYTKATDDWIDAIRAEEALATADHSMIAWEKWDAAHFQEEDARTKANAAHDAYKDALRGANIGI
jgi:hypothetical protein